MFMKRLDVMEILRNGYSIDVDLGPVMGPATMLDIYKDKYKRAEWVMVSNWSGMKAKIVRLIPKNGGVPVYDARRIIGFGRV